MAERFVTLNLTEHQAAEVARLARHFRITEEEVFQEAVGEGLQTMALGIPEEGEEPARKGDGDLDDGIPF